MKYLDSIASETKYSVEEFESKLNRMLGYSTAMREFVQTAEWDYFGQIFYKWYVEVYTYVPPPPPPAPTPPPPAPEPTPEPVPVVVPEPTPEPKKDYDKRGLETPYGNGCTTDDQCKSDEFTGYVCGKLYRNRVF